jgi:hypothetical protein
MVGEVDIAIVIVVRIAIVIEFLTSILAVESFSVMARHPMSWRKAEILSEGSSKLSN